MSVTKVENAEGKLISQEDINTKQLSIKSSQCSCLNCDSVRCFGKRKKAIKDRCECGICRDLRKKSSLPNKNSCGNKDDLENATKKIIREVVTRETIESLKRVTETMYEFSNNANFGMDIDKPIFSDKKVIPSPTKSQISIKTECNTKRVIGDTEPHLDNNTATKLSAQVMNVPYEDLHEEGILSQDLTDRNPSSKLNIFKRIKEIYDACSCKVCECISNKPRELRGNLCECKPCQCEDCVTLQKKIDEKIKRIPHSGCPCIRCDRKDCKGIAKSISGSRQCTCCSNGIQYPENVTNACKCEPCQCINCKLLGLRTSKTVKLGQIDEYVQRETCQCSPCECIECKQIYNRTNPTIMYTRPSKYGNFCRCQDCSKRCQLGMTEICKCDSRDVPSRKSFHKHRTNFDIRTVIVDNSGPFDEQRNCDYENNETVALFASLKNKYPSNSCARGICKCNECECIVCSAKDDALRSCRDNIKHNVMSLHNDIKLTTSNTNACKCTPCECEICYKKDENQNGLPFERKCRCDVCDCLNCDNASLVTSFPSSSTPHQPFVTHRRQSSKRINSFNTNENCNCTPCDCSNCRDLVSCSNSVKFYSGGKSVEKKTWRSKKVMLITPPSSETHLKSQTKLVQNVSSTTLSSNRSKEGVFRQDLSTCHAVSHHYAPVNNLSHTNKSDVCEIFQDNKEYNVTSDDDVDGEVFFNLTNAVLDTENFKSIEETSIMNCPGNSITNQHQDEPHEEKYKYLFKVIEKPEKITSNDSDESLPVYWACCDKTSYPRSTSRNVKITCETTKSNLKNVLNDRLNQMECIKSKQDDFNEQPKEKTQKAFENHAGSVKDSYSNINCIINDNNRVNIPKKTRNHSEHTDSFNTFFKENFHEYSKVTLKHSDVSIDYERATRVLWEAKAFSSKLIKMLDSFETANRQFESASQKFKVLHESLFNINECDLNQTHSTNIGRIPQPEFENTFGIITEISHEGKQSTDESGKDENEAEREYEPSTTKPDATCDDFQYTEELCTNDKSHSKHIMNRTKKENDIRIQENNEKHTILNSITIQKLHSRSELEKSNSIHILSNPLQEDISNSNNVDSNIKKGNDALKNEMENKNSESAIQKPTIESVMKKLYSVFRNITNPDTSVPTSDKEQNLAELDEQQDNEPWQIFKKNLYIHPNPIDKKTIFQSSALELDVKEAIRAISLQTANRDANIVPRPNLALRNLQSEVNDLLNMPLLQINSKFQCKIKPGGRAFPRTKLDLEVRSMCSTASSQTYEPVIKKADKEVNFNINSEKSRMSCDQLKVGLVGLRRVSDHTVLVKWKVPERIEDVQGYELLVDGRAVQKIFSPTRSMAVVTCLPPAARVLVTVRTIAAPTAGCGHAPATTVVYRPKTK